MKRFATAILIISFFILLFWHRQDMAGLFFSGNQRGWWYFTHQEYKKALYVASSPKLLAASYYRLGKFKKACDLYANISDKESLYNLGNTLVMLGDYDKAIEAYQNALKIDSNFLQAKENLRIAKARKKLKTPPNDGESGVGKLGADKVVFDNKENRGVDDQESVQNSTQSDIPAQWLDRLSTSPREFLRNKFYYQLQLRENHENK